MSVVLLGAALSVQSPATLAVVQPAPLEAPVTAAATEADLRAYSAWLSALDAVQSPLNEQFRAMSAIIGAIDWRGDLTPALVQVRAAMPPIRAEIDRTNARLAQLGTPGTAANFAPEDLRPAMYLRHRAALNRELGEVLSRMIPLLDRGQHGSIGEFQNAFRTVAEAHLAISKGALLRIRAQRAATERNSPAWLMIGATAMKEQLAGAFLADVLVSLRERPPVELAGTLTRLAEEAEALARNWNDAVGRFRPLSAAQAASAHASGDPAAVRVARVARLELELLERLLPLVQQQAELVRSSTATVAGDDLERRATTRLRQELRSLDGQMDSLMAAAQRQRTELLATPG